MGTVLRSLTGPVVGRERELARLTDAVRAGGVTYVHGLPGIGKSALLGAFADDARTGGTHVIALDCRAVEPTERGFLHGAGGFADAEALVEHLRVHAPAVLVLDQYENFRLMDSWLRRTLVPALPDDVAVVLGCRERPLAAW